MLALSKFVLQAITTMSRTTKSRAPYLHALTSPCEDNIIGVSYV